MGQAAAEVYFCVARFVIKQGLNWYLKLYLSPDTEFPRSANDEGTSVSKPLEKERRNKKRKRQKSATETAERHNGSSVQDSFKAVAEERNYDASACRSLLSCLTEVIGLWDEQVIQGKIPKQALNLQHTSYIDGNYSYNTFL